MDDAILKVFADAPVLLLVFFVARWLGTRIDRVMDLHERMLERLLDLTERQVAKPTDSQRFKLPPLS